MWFKGKSIESMTPKELASGALRTRSPLHRVALVAELLHRLAPHDVTPMLNSLPIQERKQYGKPDAGSGSLAGASGEQQEHDQDQVTGDR